MEQWQSIKSWAEVEDFDFWLRQQGLANNQTIIAKLVDTEEVVLFASGTRRFRYSDGTFYLEAAPPAPPDIGTGKHIDIKALRARWQGLCPNAQITARLDKTGISAAGMREWDKNEKIGVDIYLNPTRLRSPAQVAEKVAWIERELTRY